MPSRIHRFQLVYFFIIIAAVFVLTFFVFQPYLAAIFLALVFAIIFQPIYRKILPLVKRKQALASFITVTGIVLIVLIPLIFFGIVFLRESSNLYLNAVGQSEGVSVLFTLTSGLEQFINSVFPGFNVNISSYVDFSQYLEAISGWFLDNVGFFFSSIFRGALSLIIMIVALYYFLKDGGRLSRALVFLSPLPDSYDKMIFSKIETAINSVIRGYIIIAIIKSLLAGIGFLFFGVPSPVIWAFVTAISSFVPVIGTGLVFAPIVLFLFITGKVFAGIGMFLWGTLIVGLVDNFIGPFLITRGVKIHPFLILVSVLGGLELFGPVGFIAGPVILSLLFSLLEIYPLITKSETLQG